MNTNQPVLFNPDLEPIRYIAQHGEFEFTLDGKFQTFWLSQKQIASLFGITQQAVSLHVQNFKKNRSDDPIPAYKDSLYVGDDGKQREIEQYNHNVVIYIGYRAQATAETIRFQRFVEEIFRQRLEAEHARAMHKAKHARSQDVTSYILAGMSQSHAEKRVDMKSTFKQLSAIVIEIADAKMIGAIVSKEYLLLFGKLTNELKTILRTKNVRDALPELQLDYLDLTEKSLIAVLPHCANMKREQIVLLVEKTIRPLAEHLKMICELSGVNVITGKPELGDGK